MERPRFAPEREREFSARGWWGDDTLPQWLARHAKERPDQQAVAFPGGALTWKGLQERVLKAAQGLKTRGVSHGDVVAVQLHRHHVAVADAARLQALRSFKDALLEAFPRQCPSRKRHRLLIRSLLGVPRQPLRQRVVAPPAASAEFALALRSEAGPFHRAAILAARKTKLLKPARACRSPRAP